jgi:copper chaperone
MLPPSPHTPLVYVEDHPPMHKDHPHMSHFSSTTAHETTYLVDGMSCDHCTIAVRGEVSRIPGVASVDVDLPSKRVRVRGAGVDVDDAAVIAAIDEAGYDAVAA